MGVKHVIKEEETMESHCSSVLAGSAEESTTAHVIMAITASDSKQAAFHKVEQALAEGTAPGQPSRTRLIDVVCVFPEAWTHPGSLLTALLRALHCPNTAQQGLQQSLDFCIHFGATYHQGGVVDADVPLRSLHPQHHAACWNPSLKHAPLR